MTDNIIEGHEQVPRPQQSVIFTYSDIFFSYYFNNDTFCSHSQPNHALSYVYSGEMVLTEGDKELSVRKGECVFIKRDHRVSMMKKSYDGEPYRGIFVMFNRNTLREMFRQSGTDKIPEDASRFTESFFNLPPSAEIESLFSSMVPYFNPAVKPRDEFMTLKLRESIMVLLSMDKRFYPTLFDFAEPWKIDILDFLDRNYMYELSMEEIANYTGRSLATFKRDFRKVSDLTPQKWIIRKRLEVAYEKMKQQGQRVTEVYSEVGFKNLSHFSTAFKKHFGVPPTSLSQ